MKVQFMTCRDLEIISLCSSKPMEDFGHRGSPERPSHGLDSMERLKFYGCAIRYDDSAMSRHRKRAEWARFPMEFQRWFEWVHWRYCVTAEPTWCANVYGDQVPDYGGWIKIRIVGKMLEVYYESSYQRTNTCA